MTQTIIAQDDFSNGADGWSHAGQGNNGELGGFLGRFGAGDSTEKTFDVPGGAESVTITFDFLEIDSWDSERFFVEVNGQRIDLGAFSSSHDEGSRSGATGDIAWSIASQGGPSNVGFGGWKDQVHKVTLEVPASAISGDAVTLKFASTLNEGFQNEAFGIDNVSVLATLPSGSAVADPAPSAPAAAEVVIAHEDFEDNADGWSHARRDHDNDLSDFLGRFSKGESTEKTFNVPSGVEALKITFDFLEIDSWDDEHFFVEIDGHKVNLGGYNHRTDEGDRSGVSGDIAWSVSSKAGPSQIGFKGWNDQSHSVTLEVPASAISGDHVTVKFSSSLNQDRHDESFGIDNFKIVGVMPSVADPAPSAPAAAEVVIAHEDFEDNANGWSHARRDHDNDLTDFLGRFSKGESTEKTFNVPSGVETLKITFDFLEIDSWDNENFFVEIDGHKVDLGSYNLYKDEGDRSGVSGDIAWSVASQGGPANFAFGGWKDQVHKVTLEVPASAISGDAVTLKFSSTLNEGVNNESFGIDNLKIVGVMPNVAADPAPSAPAAAEVEIAHEDFEDNADGWSHARRDHDNDLSDFLGRFSKGESTEKTFNVPSGVEALKITFDFLEIDSWDDEHFFVEIDGHKVNLGGYNHRTDEGDRSGVSGDIAWSVSSKAGPSQIGFKGWNDQSHSVTLEVPASAISGDHVTVKFSSSLNQDRHDESFGIDNFKIVGVMASGAEFRVCDDPDAVNLGFDGFDAGAVISDQIDGLTISAQRFDNNTAANDAMVFDSANPTGGDGDLATATQGNILIVSEDNDSSDADDAKGGVITIDFDEPAFVFDLKVVDTEEGGTITLRGENGSVLATFTIPSIANGAIDQVLIDVDGVSQMEVRLAGSGAIDDLCYIPGEPGSAASPVPSPTPSQPLIARLDFEGDAVTTDDSAVQDTAVLNGDAMISGGALMLDGHGDYAELAPNTGYELDNGRIVVDFAADDVSGVNTLFSRDSSGFDGGGHFDLAVVDGAIKVRIQSDKGSREIVTDHVVSNGQRAIVAVEFGDDGIKVFVDGVLEGENDFTGGLAGNREPITIGATQKFSGGGVADNLRDFFAGKIFDVSIEGEGLAPNGFLPSIPAFTNIPDNGHISITENTPFVVDLETNRGDDVTYEIIRGDGAALFDIDPNTGALSFRFSPDFENPADKGGDNDYDLTIKATAADGSSGEKRLKITVTDDASEPTTGPATPPAGELCVVDFNTGPNGEALKNADVLQQGFKIDIMTVTTPSSTNPFVIQDTSNPAVLANSSQDHVTANQGNALAISKSANPTNSAEKAGDTDFTLEFDFPVFMQSITTIDNEEGGVIRLFNAAGDLVNVAPIPRVNNGVLQVIELNTADVARVEFDSEGSTFIDDITYVKPADPQLAALGDKVFFDLDRDGVQDAGEGGVEGVTVTLTGGGADGVIGTGGDDTTETLTTDADGEYLFEGLNPGEEYKVTFSDIPAGFEFTQADQGGDDALDSDANPANGMTQVVTLAPGETNRTLDAGIVSQLGSLSGRYFCDENDNDVDDAEPGVANVLVTLLDANGAPTGETTRTASDGSYSFTGLEAGTYGVRFTDPDGALAGKQLVTPNVGGDDAIDSDAIGDTTSATISTITVVAGQNTADNDAGAEKTAALGDKVFFDLDRDGVQDAGEGGVEGVTVTLTGGGADGVIGTADDTTETLTTDADGEYLFEGLNPGEEYKVTFSDIPAGFEFTQADQGGDDALDSDADPTNGMTQVVTLAPGETNRTLDAGLIVPNTAPVAAGETLNVCVGQEFVLDANGQRIPDGQGGFVEQDRADVVADLLANDSDAEGDVTLVSISANGQTATAVGDSITTAEGLVVTLNGDASTGALDGTVTINRVDAAPDLAIGETLPDGFDYVIADEDGATANASVAVTLKGDENTLETIESSLSAGTVEFQVSAGRGRYFDIILDDPSALPDDGVGTPGDGVFEAAYCVNVLPSTAFNTDLHAEVSVLGSGTEPDVFDVSGAELDAGIAVTNWILNQQFTGTFTEFEQQWAIWRALNIEPFDADPSGAFDNDAFFNFYRGSEANADALYDQAIANGAETFSIEADGVIDADEVVGLLLNVTSPTDSAGDPLFPQPLIVGVRAGELLDDCFCVDDGVLM